MWLIERLCRSLLIINILWWTDFTIASILRTPSHRSKTEMKQRSAKQACSNINEVLIYCFKNTSFIIVCTSNHYFNFFPSNHIKTTMDSSGFCKAWRERYLFGWIILGEGRAPKLPPFHQTSCLLNGSWPGGSPALQLRGIWCQKSPSWTHWGSFPCWRLSNMVTNILWENSTDDSAFLPACPWNILPMLVNCPPFLVHLLFLSLPLLTPPSLNNLFPLCDDLLGISFATPF